jgi:hypothetical protein
MEERREEKREGERWEGEIMSDESHGCERERETVCVCVCVRESE